jgi:hypothetical protein
MTVGAASGIMMTAAGTTATDRMVLAGYGQQILVDRVVLVGVRCRF